jgi:glycosyltransferase involved in cell wall biosynthesis
VIANPAHAMHVILAATNDITGDQRVMRTAYTLSRMNHSVTVICRKRNPVPDPLTADFRARRLTMLFEKGPLFYAEFNVRLSFILLFSAMDVVFANDLDTLLAAYIASKIRKKPLVYDSHEYFTEVPELTGRPFVKKIWEKIEGFLLPRLTSTCTVSESVAEAYKRKYSVDMAVIRNLPFRKDHFSKQEINLNTGSEKIIIYQGVLNMGRGLEMAIDAMTHTEKIKLVIAGTGDIEKELKERVAVKGLNGKVIFTGRIDPALLYSYTCQADAGISLEEDLGLNYRYALPNKLFDYIQAHVPVLVSNLPEMRKIVEGYEIGLISNARDEKELAALFIQMVTDTEKRAVWKNNLEKAAAELCWENEEYKLKSLFQTAISGHAFRATKTKKP